MEIGRIIEGMSKDLDVMHVPDRAHDAAQEEQNNNHHAGTEGLIQLRRGLDARRFIQVKKAAKKIIQM